MGIKVIGTRRGRGGEKQEGGGVGERRKADEKKSREAPSFPFATAKARKWPEGARVKEQEKEKGGGGHLGGER